MTMRIVKKAKVATNIFSDPIIFSSISQIIILAGGTLTGLCADGASQNLLTLSRAEHAASPIFDSSHLRESKCLLGTVAPFFLNLPKKVRIATLSGVFQFIFDFLRKRSPKFQSVEVLN